jgi:hypothetical protein
MNILKLQLLLDRMPLTAYERAEANAILQQIQKTLQEQQELIKELKDDRP